MNVRELAATAGVAILGAGLGLLALAAMAPDDAETAPDPLALREGESARGERPVVLDRDDEEDLAAGRDLPVGFVPDLPEVPTLPEGTHVPRADESAREAEASPDDERLAALGSEMRLVRDARDSLERDPTQALALLEQHRARFPDGALAEEREAYAIQALAVLGRTTEVERRYLDFRADHPGSSFLPTLERLLSSD